ncbi:uncharacterized protein N7484_000041 [Penicillium longicatenatum]|uniref:uncharacterized protein n=1 Tax=Penicillium longicatenatum TaxID=1561947 RepID=UPI0025490965|nr:uncharacterized protein N7484_000041 [Penicillium longicatenatum]KAJ5660669.1 hypothetical protein N7484_000041 [Penicillium longicatenatum]
MPSRYPEPVVMINGSLNLPYQSPKMAPTKASRKMAPTKSSRNMATTKVSQKRAASKGPHELRREASAAEEKWATEMELKWCKQGFPVENKESFRETMIAVIEALHGRGCFGITGSAAGRKITDNPEFKSQWDAFQKETTLSRRRDPPKDFLDEQGRKLKLFPDQLRQFMKKNGIAPENVFFLSNRGYRLHIDGKTASTVSCPKKRGTGPKSVSALYCLPFNGKPLPPFFTFQRKYGDPQFTHDKFEVMSSSDGWITESDLFTWRKKVFEEPTVPSKPLKRKRSVAKLLLFDGESIPISKEFFVSSELEENIFCHAFPRGMSTMFTSLEGETCLRSRPTLPTTREI